MLCDLAADWRARAGLFREHGADLQARLLEHVADELEAHLNAMENDAVNLTVAARLSGYDADYLGELIREGKIFNAGKKYRPLIRLRDLPRKAGCAGDTGTATVLSLEASRRKSGLEEGPVRRRVRAHGRGDAPRRLPKPLSQVGG